MIVLSDQGYSKAFNAGSQGPYLAKTLVKQGELIPNYYAVTQGELANEIALISGQGPTPQTEADCSVFADITPFTIGSLGQVLGTGCVYPSSTKTLPGQLTAAHLTWKAYVEGVVQPCLHPALGAADTRTSATAGNPYVTWRDPFVYFHSVIDANSCAKHDVDLSKLAADLRTKRRTPSLSYIVPSPCDDGSDTPCTPSAPAGLAQSDTFLRHVVPEIEKSAAYKAGGMIVITFDQAPQTGAGADTSSCCDQPETYPNLASTSATTGTATTGTGATTTATTGTTTTDTGPTSTPTGPVGGGQVGLLLISPYILRGGLNVTDTFNHFALLRSIEDLFGLHHLGYAADPLLSGFNATVYTNYRQSSG